MISWDRPQLILKGSAGYSWCLLLNVLGMTFLAVFSAVSTMLAGDCIQGELALSSTRSIWTTTLYLLGVNTTVPMATWLSNHYGYKRMYAIGSLLFASGSLLAALSIGFYTISFARIMEGIGAGLVFPVGLAFLVQNFPKEKLPLVLSLYVSAAFGGGLGIGLPVSGYIAQFLTWRFIFWMMVPIALGGFLCCWLFCEESEKKPPKAKFDIWGALCFSTFIASLLIALTLGPLKSSDSGWLTPYILICFTIAAISLICLFYIESHHPDPIIPLVLFKDPVFSISALAMFLLGMSIFASVSVSADYMLHALFYEKFVSGKVAMIYGIVMAVCSILANLLIKCKIPIPVLTLFGLSLLIASYFLNNRIDWQTGATQVSQILFLRGMGVGLALGPVTVRALLNVPKELSNHAATLLTFFRQVGGTYGGTLISIISIKRTIFHAARFGEQANQQIPGYQRTFEKVYSHTFSDLAASSAQAKGKIIANIEIQAYIQGQNDALIVFGYLTIVIAVLLASLNILNWWKERKASSLGHNAEF